MNTNDFQSLKTIEKLMLAYKTDYTVVVRHHH